jgi:hypothetical protein
MRFLTALVACVFLPGIFLAEKSSEQLGPDGDMRVSIDGIKIFSRCGKAIFWLG